MKFQTIANKIDKIDEFELVWFFFEALDPRVRAELESKNVETLDDAIRHARIFSKGLGILGKFKVVNYSKQNNFNKDSFKKPAINGKEYASKYRSQKIDQKGKENFSKFRNHNYEIKKETLCFGCKKPGHNISQCRVKYNNPKRKINIVEEVNK